MFLSAHESPNISFHPEGIDYDELPDELPRHDVGLILYRARSQNFLFNETNKLFEYRACGLSVWYPRQMKSIERVREETADSSLLPLSFESLPGTIPNPEACPESELCHRRAGEVLARLHDKLISETAS